MNNTPNISYNENERNEEAKRKFNRDLVVRLTGLTGDRLDSFIFDFLNRKSRECGMMPIEWVLSVPDMEKEILNFWRIEDIEKEILNFQRNYNEHYI